jgi:hypothetical protein
MRIPEEEIAAAVDEAPRVKRRARRRSLDRLVSATRRKVRNAIASQMSGPFFLLEEAVRFMLSFEEYQFSRELTKESSPFALHTTRLRTDLFSIRELIGMGQETSALALARVFVEDLEIAMALGIDPEFAVAYFESSDKDEFWSSQVGYGKLYPRVRKFLARGGGDDESTDGRIDHHRRVKTFLSGHVHPSSSAAFRAAFPPSLEHPGHMARRPLGYVSDNLAPLCLSIAEEVRVFSGCCINMFIIPDPPPAFANYEPSGLMDDFLAAANVLQELGMKYHDEMWAQHGFARDKWEEGLGGKNET